MSPYCEWFCGRFVFVCKFFSIIFAHPNSCFSLRAASVFFKAGRGSNWNWVARGLICMQRHCSDKAPHCSLIVCRILALRREEDGGFISQNVVHRERSAIHRDWAK